MENLSAQPETNHCYGKDGMKQFITPQSIAIVGASKNFVKMGAIVTHNIRAGGYGGGVYPINPNAETIHGYKAYPSLHECPPPDLVVILVPQRAVRSVLQDCIDLKLHHIVLVTAGYRELGPEGAATEAEIAQLAQIHDLKIIGPNCLGLSIPSIKLNMTTMPYLPPAGPVAFISQSGAFAAQNFIALDRWGLGVSIVFSTGNEAVLTCSDFIQMCADDPRTRVIMLYIEGLRDGPRFLATAQRITPHKPLLLMKVGRTPDGQRAATSHTGAIAGQSRIFEGAMRQAGVVLGKTLEELFDWAMAFSHQPLPHGNRVAILTNSGGPGVSLTDVCAEEGLILPPIHAEVQNQLAALLPPTAVTKNPVDMTFTIDMRLFAQGADLLLQQADIDALLIHGFFGPSLIDRFGQSPEVPEKFLTTLQQQSLNATQQLIQTINRYQKPVLISSTQTRSDPAIQQLQDAGIPVYPMPERAASTLGTMVRYASWRQHSFHAK
jgi:acyl-CoA synthetase (NDP forming)